MWFRLGLPNFIAKTIVRNDGCDIFVSNFVHIWQKSLTDNELLLISKTLNPLFEATLQKLKELTLGLFSENEKIQKEIQEKDNEIFLKLESNRMGIKFQFQVFLQLGSAELLYKEFTLPLLSMTVKMHNKTQNLIKVIKDKDAEINEYKQENEMVKFGSAATKPFSENDCDNWDISSQILSTINSDPSIFLDFVDKKLLKEQILIKEEQQASSHQGEHAINKGSVSDRKNLIFKNKSINTSNNSKSCVKFGNEIIKRRKKQNLTSKIRI